MAGYRRPGPVCSTTDGFDLGTLARVQSPIRGPVCSLRIEDIVAEAAARGEHTSPVANRNKARKNIRARKTLLTPTLTVMETINTELGTKVNFKRLAVFEGGQHLDAYIPRDDSGKVAGRSGVTIATGFDIGQFSISDIRTKLGLSLTLQEKYKRFCNKQKQRAIDELEGSGGLSVLKHEADETDLKVQKFHLVAAMAAWDDEPKPAMKFTELTPAQQTVILSRTYHQGPGMPFSRVAQDFYWAGQKGDWAAAERALRNYAVTADWYKLRVKQEADYLAADLPRQTSANREIPPKGSRT